MMELFKCSASQSGKLLPDPKSKSESLSQTTKTYINEWMQQRIYGVKKEITNKYLSKGILQEDEAIDKAIEWLDLPFCLKNTERFYNDWFEGEPDLIVGESIFDIKNSWDCFTFPLFETEIPTRDYESQVNVYMDLLGLKKASVIYVLLNTPATFNTPEIDYSQIPTKYRIKKYDFEYNQVLIDKLKMRVDQSREYINQFNYLL